MTAAVALFLFSSTTYEVAGDQSLLFVQVYKDPDTLLAGLSHDHVVRATELTGTATTGDDTCAATVEIPVSGLEPDEPWLRTKLGLPDDLDDGDRAKIKSHMLAGDQLDATSYSRIVVGITGCKVVDDSERVNLTGTLEIRGQRRPLAVTANVTRDDGNLRARGSFTKRHTDFGFSPYSAGLGTLKNRDEMTFVFDLVLRRR